MFGGNTILMRSAFLCAAILTVVLAIPLPGPAGGDNMSNDIPVLTPTYVGEAQKTVGKISDSTWATVPAAEGFRLVGSGDPATQSTLVRVCYDRLALHIRFECSEDSMGSLVLQHREDGAPVWQDDSVEVFISPYSVASKAKSHQFVVNAAGAKSYLQPGASPSSMDWRAAVVRQSDRWVADIVIPFDALRPLGRNEDCWRINFCRNEHPHSESSSWSPVSRWYATFSRFGRLVPPAAPFRFNTFRGKPVPLQPVASGSGGLVPVSGPIEETAAAPVIIPEPQEVHRRPTKGVFMIDSDTRIVLADDAGEIDLHTAEELNSALESMGAKALQVVRDCALGSNPDRVRNAVLLGEGARHRLLRAFCERDQVRLPRSRFGTTSHVVDVLPDRIVVTGQTKTDTFYGVQTLKQMITRRGDGSIAIPANAIRDYPRFQFRGAHLLAASDGLAYNGKLIERVLAPLKVNHIVLQTDKIVWKSHPEVTDPKNHMTQQDVRKLIEIAKRRHMTVTPLVQSPGHLEWAFRDRNNLDFAEDPSQPYCYCMSNPKSYKFIFEIMDEAIELFGNPEYFHAGRDEFDMRGIYPHDDACRALGKERLYIQDTLRIHEHLLSRGCRMMMWGDILLKPGFRGLIDELPKDILINDWHYAPAAQYPSIEFFQSHGFEVVGCTWYNPRNIFAFSGQAARQSILGMMQTTWTGFEPEEQVLRKYPAQAYGYILSAAWAWNPVRPQMSDLPYRPESVFGRMWNGPSTTTAARFATVDLRPFCNLSRSDSGRAMGWLGVGRGCDLRSMPEGLMRTGGVPYRVLGGGTGQPSVVMLGGDGMMDAFPRHVNGIPVGSRVKALHFLHGCAYAVQADERVGAFTVRYSDGGTEEIPLICERNTYAWDDQSLGMAYGFAWRGKSPDGRAVGVCDLAWTNKRPDVEIESIDFAAAPTQASPFLVAVTAEM